MTSYFDEHDCIPTESSPVEHEHDLLEILRRLLSHHDFDDLIPISEKLAPPASMNTVKDLPRRTPTKAEKDDQLKCPVCLLPYDDVIIEMPCTHCFHKDCLLPWLQKTNSCPVCRYELLTDDPVYEQYKIEKEKEKGRQFRVDQLHDSMFG